MVPKATKSAWANLLSTEKLTVVLLLGLTAWGASQIFLQYPSSFFPRFADEAIYAFDAEVPSSIFDEFKENRVRYAPAKLGYGLPLVASFALFGPDGPMFLSTLFWLLTVATIGFVAFHRLGLVESVIWYPTVNVI